MGKLFIGGLAAIMLLLGGFLYIYGRAQDNQPVLAPPPPPQNQEDTILELPTADTEDMVGPAPPESTPLTREQRRFARYDRNFDKKITRTEMLSSRTKDFKKLDKDGNNLLTFEEWAVRTSDRFGRADANGNGELTPEEFATTKSQKSKRPQSKCSC